LKTGKAGRRINPKKMIKRQKHKHQHRKPQGPGEKMDSRPYHRGKKKEENGKSARIKSPRKEPGGFSAAEYAQKYLQRGTFFLFSKKRGEWGKSQTRGSKERTATKKAGLRQN